MAVTIGEDSHLGLLCCSGHRAQDWACRTRGRGTDLRYPLSRVPVHPLRALGVCALGSTFGDNGVSMYHCRTVEHGETVFRYNDCYSILWPWSNPWPLLLVRTPTWNSYAALDIGARLLVRRTHGRGTVLNYLLSRVPAHPLRALGVCALRSTLRDNGVSMYHGRTATWCCPTKCFEKIIPKVFLPWVPLHIKEPPFYLMGDPEEARIHRP
jgi:hypothetical protein